MGFGGTGRKRKGPCTKQCAWRKHGSSNTRLAEACPPKLQNTVKYRVEEMRPKWPFWKHRAPKMHLVEAQGAHRKHCYPEIPLGSHPTSRVSQSYFGEVQGTSRNFGSLVAQCSATPTTVSATPPCSATPFQTQISVRHLPGMGGGERCDT